jgi:hypothetical protein
LRQVYGDVIREGKKYGKLGAQVSEECEITFPEIISENKAERIQNIVLAYSSKFISLETAATMVAKELGITSFDFKTEQGKILAEGVQAAANDPLINQMYAKPQVGASGPVPATPAGAGGGSSVQTSGYNGDTNGLSNQTRNDLKDKLNTKESISGSTMGVLQRNGQKQAEQPKKPFGMASARREALLMSKAKFQLAEGDKSIPKGWEDTVKKLKQHPEFEDPKKLSHWMESMGYAPK